MKLLIVSAILLFLAGMVSSQSFDCDLQNDVGCNNNLPTFLFFLHTVNSGGDSNCKHSYKLRINLNSTQNGFYCWFHTNNPHQYIYTISNKASATGKNSVSAYLYGKGADARLDMKEGAPGGSIYNSNYWFYDHIHPDTNSAAYYWFSNDKFISRNRLGTSRIGNPYLFEPKNTNTYIGLNRRYADSFQKGTGLCRVRCYVF